MLRIPRFRPPLSLRDSLSVLMPGRGPRDPWAELEERFARMLGVAHAIAAPSCRVATEAAAHALKLPQGGEVSMPSLTFHSIPATFARAGLKLRFVDIDPGTYNLDIDRLEGAIGPSTVAIAPVHLYGRASNMPRIRELADQHGLKVIEDVAQACGARSGERMAGAWGDAAVFSFHPAKNLSALWAGMVATDSDEVAEGVRAFLRGLPTLSRSGVAGRWLSSAGMAAVTSTPAWLSFMHPALRACASVSFDPVAWLASEVPGKTAGMDRDARLMPRPLQGVVALRQLASLPEHNRLRIRNGERLLQGLQGTPGLSIPAPAEPGESIFMSFVVRVDERERFRRRLLRLGVDSHPGNMHVGPRIPGIDATGDEEIAAEVNERMVHLPVYPDLSLGDMDRIAGAVKAALKALHCSSSSAFTSADP